ncbi:MAG TPA: hypothetical protein VLF18_17410 [Tahibacter sp.]|nr:hypothetical protein [Tahibacter sp.]HSX61968.1 hypothetical protein [Tahibacter sp.]
MPTAPGRALASFQAGPKASVRPESPASTIWSTPSAATRNRATGRVSAQGQGFAAVSPASLRCQARSSSTCASAALACK